MKITYSLTKEEAVEAHREYRAGNSQLSVASKRIMLAFSTALLALLAVFVFLFDRNWLSCLTVLLLLAICVYFFLMELFGWEMFSARYFDKNPSLRKEYTVEFSEDGVETSAADSHSKNDWSHFQAWRESGNLFLVYPNPRLFNVYPKRAFAPRDVDRFRKLLARKIPKVPKT